MKSAGKITFGKPENLEKTFCVGIEIRIQTSFMISN